MLFLGKMERGKNGKIIIEIDDELKKKFQIKTFEEEKTQKEALTQLIEDYVKELI